MGKALDTRMGTLRLTLSTMLSVAVSGAAAPEGISHFSLQAITATPRVRSLASIRATLPAGIDYIVQDSPDLVSWHRVSSLLRPAGEMLEWNHAQYDGALGTRDLYADGTASWRSRRFYRVRPLPPAEPAPDVTGAPVPPTGRLSQPVAKGPYRLKTQGNWSLVIQGTTLTVNNPTGTVKYEIWGVGSGGTGHESLNGKHLKDMFGGARTILLPDGTIITVGISAPAGLNTIGQFSIYDGDQSHRLTTYPDSAGNPNTLEMSVLLRRAGEAAEPDGETCRILDTPSGAYVENIYQQSAPADGQPVPQSATPLGRTGGPDKPNQIDDYFDDPRLGHT